MPDFETVSDLVHVYPDYFNAAAAEGIDGVVFLDLDGEKGGQFAITIKDQEIEIEEGVVPEDPTVTIKTTGERWLQINRGDANPMTLMMTGKLKISGSMSMATKFQGLFDV